jgi:hypothetical protein
MHEHSLFSHMPNPAASFDIPLTYVTLYCTFGLRLSSKWDRTVTFDGAARHSRIN